jgi:CDP-diacylglycerol--glycerol-3-phosphate 3-phosphatidyltransferase
MNLPNKLTVLRIILSPLYFVFFFLPQWTGGGALVSAILLSLVFILIEVSDLLDGYIARKHNLVTDIGKVLDPFADVLSRLTYFVCFAYAGIMPLWILLVLMYREIGITFVRMLMMRKGTAMAASVFGKAKAVTYMLSGIVGLFMHISGLIGLPQGLYDVIRVAGLVIFVVAALSSVLSFLTYIVAIAKDEKASASA